VRLESDREYALRVGSPWQHFRACRTNRVPLRAAVRVVWQTRSVRDAGQMTIRALLGCCAAGAVVWVGFIAVVWTVAGWVTG
jgi:hypothetical protein